MKKFAIVIAMFLTFAASTSAIAATEKYMIKGSDNFIATTDDEFITVLDGKVDMRCDFIVSEPGVDNIGKKYIVNMYNCTKDRSKLDFISMVKKGIAEDNTPYRGVTLFHKKKIVESWAWVKNGKDWIYAGKSKDL